TTIYCTYFPDSKSGSDVSGINVKGTIHWVSQAHARTAEIRIYDRLFKEENPASLPDFKTAINPDSLRIIEQAFIEPDLINAQQGLGYQFLRKGYYTLDKESLPDKLIFNQTVGLRDDWSKKNKKS